MTGRAPAPSRSCATRGSRACCTPCSARPPREELARRAAQGGADRAAARQGRRERVDADGGITGVCLGGYGGGTTLSPAPAKSFGVHRMRKNEVTGKVGGSFGDVAAMQRVMGHDAHHPNAMPPPRRFNDRAIDAHASSSVYVPGGGFGDGDDRWGDGVTGKVGSGVATNQRNRVQPPRGFQRQGDQRARQ